MSATQNAMRKILECYMEEKGLENFLESFQSSSSAVDTYLQSQAIRKPKKFIKRFLDIKKPTKTVTMRDYSPKNVTMRDSSPKFEEFLLSREIAEKVTKGLYEYLIDRGLTKILVPIPYNLTSTSVFSLEDRGCRVDDLKERYLNRCLVSDQTSPWSEPFEKLGRQYLKELGMSIIKCSLTIDSGWWSPYRNKLANLISEEWQLISFELGIDRKETVSINKRPDARWLDFMHVLKERVYPIKKLKEALNRLNTRRMRDILHFIEDCEEQIRKE